jgi:hypothetical protein
LIPLARTELRRYTSRTLSRATLPPRGECANGDRCGVHPAGSEPRHYGARADLRKRVSTISQVRNIRNCCRFGRGEWPTETAYSATNTKKAIITAGSSAITTMAHCTG